MTVSNQINPGMTISLSGNIYRVESSVKVTVAKGVPFIKTKLKNLITEEVIEKNFKVDQAVEEVALAEKNLEFLYMEGKDYLFLDIDGLDQVIVPSDVVSDKVNYLKEGIKLKALFYGEMIFSVELPQFLELMVMKTESPSNKVAVSSSGKYAILETGAKIEVPLFIESGDIIKVDTQNNEYIQRV
ncbi:MAG: Elongation factor P [Chlamydiia bacterium]|nr:Elongation factor P [Chlamydiia bacterium]